jgi:hypothetical protein
MTGDPLRLPPTSAGTVAVAVVDMVRLYRSSFGDGTLASQGFSNP